MRRSALTVMPFMLLIAACGINENGTLAQLRQVDMEITDAQIDGGLEKAMEAYQQFLEQTPESAMTPEAIRRLADLNVEREYGTVTGSAASSPAQTAMAAPELSQPEGQPAIKATESNVKDSGVIADVSESEKNFEARATAQQKLGKNTADNAATLPDGSKVNDLETAGAKKAIALYKKLLTQYPLYDRNDQVLYQLSRAYEETGQVEEAMKVMNRLVGEYPKSRHFDEVQFRRAEYFFTRKKFLDAEDAYKSILAMGKSSSYFELSLYKQGWTFYKQELYEDALQNFMGLLDHKVNIGYDFEQTENKVEKKRMDDTYRVISLSFSNMGGADAVVEFFDKYGSRSYESNVYGHLGEFYLSKRRYADAANSYKAFVSRNPFNKVSPHFNMRIIDIYMQGGFPRLVIEAKKDFASTYGIKADYWKYFDIKLNQDVVAYLKKNIIDLANHYHAVFQDKKYADKRRDNFQEASHWYKEFLDSFPKDELSPGINYQLADLLLENRDYLAAATEYEKTAYDYPVNKKSSSAGYAAVYAYREHLKTVSQFEQDSVKREVVRVSLRFVDVFPEHEKAAIVLGAAVDDLYVMKDYHLAVKSGYQLVEKFPDAKKDIRRSAWLVIAYSTFELSKFAESEKAYTQVLALTEANDPKRNELLDNLAAAVYKQGEEALKANDHRTAANHFLRIAKLAPNSKIRPTAEYDAATALIQLKDWAKAAEVLLAFRSNYPKHKLQSEITKKIAYVYREDGKFKQAAVEFERIERESVGNDDLRRESLLLAAELYEKIPDMDNALRVYKSYVGYFPRPVEFALETQWKIADIYKEKDDQVSFLQVLNYIIRADASAGAERTDRTRYLAANASLTITEPIFEEFTAIRLVKPFKKNLKLKKDKMKANINRYNKLVEYGVGHVTAAATYYIAETYYDFSRALMDSERPTNLSALELEQYNLLIEEQAYPFEEKAIDVHKKNLELLTLGVYSPWIDRSLRKLGKLFPGRYAKYEETTGVMESMLGFSYVSVEAQEAQKKLRAAQASKPDVQVSKANAQADEVPANPAGSTQAAEKPAEQSSQQEPEQAASPDTSATADSGAEKPQDSSPQDAQQQAPGAEATTSTEAVATGETTGETADKPAAGDIESEAPQVQGSPAGDGQ